MFAIDINGFYTLGFSDIAHGLFLKENPVINGKPREMFRSKLSPIKETRLSIVELSNVCFLLKKQSCDKLSTTRRNDEMTIPNPVQCITPEALFVQTLSDGLSTGMWSSTISYFGWKSVSELESYVRPALEKQGWKLVRLKYFYVPYFANGICLSYQCTPQTHEKDENLQQIVESHNRVPIYKIWKLFK